MKNKYLLLGALLALFATKTYAQQGFGTSNPAPSAVVDMVSSNKGALLPRLALTSTSIAAPVTSPANALTVFNTATAGDVTPGYYYWSTASSKWIRMIDGVTTNTLTATNGNLISTVNGVVSTPAVPVLISASNGLIASSGDVKLGGSLTAATTLTATAANTLAVAGLQTGSTADDLVVADVSTGVLKKIPTSSFTNIYTANGTLTGNRVVTMGTNSLGFVNGSSRFNLSNSTTDANATLTATGRANMRWAAGTSNLDIFQDSGTVGQIAINGASTGLLVGSATGSATPVSLMTNGTTRAVVTSTGDIYTTGTWVGIGTSSKSSFADEALRVNGKIRTITSVYADYVFEDYFKGFSDLNKDYKFKSLKETADFIDRNHHLPGVTPINELEKTDKGYSFDISSLTIQNLEKVEELYLHVIEQQKQLDAKDKEIDTLKNELKMQSDTTNERLEKLELLLKNK